MHAGIVLDQFWSKRCDTLCIFITVIKSTDITRFKHVKKCNFTYILFPKVSRLFCAGFVESLHVKLHAIKSDNLVPLANRLEHSLLLHHVVRNIVHYLTTLRSSRMVPERIPCILGKPANASNTFMGQCMLERKETIV